ncbi:MAG: LysM peptidoglycan-binding domain-containing protein [Proteobacteria bacterium]|nr:LysM peptidoglycan-binding domain-containing protein [Pseudomonadota bacterium]
MIRAVVFVRLALFVLSSVLTACVSGTSAPVHDDGHGLREPSKSYREVVPGDTLFSIAWESGMDYHQLAEWNDIGNDFIIRPGQRIRLSPASGKRSRQQATRNTRNKGVTRYRVRRGDTIYSIARRFNLRPAKLAAANSLKNNRIYPGQVLHIGKGATHKPRRVSVAHKQPRTGARTTRTGNKRPIKAYKGNWRWPTDGRLIGRYTGKGKKKGIEIVGKRGQAIVAAANGKVVYQGSGLRGYGRLLILKHNDDYLSAYAHCENTYAKEGDVIKQGGKIATMGDSGTDTVKLHFEIRYRGNPVNPLKHLPRQ